MNREDATQRVNSAIDELAAALDQGHSQQLTAYLSTMAKFYRYSLHNVILIALQRPDATHVAGFQAWKKLGRFVRRGESGIAILAPLVYRKNAGRQDAQSAEFPEDHAAVAVLHGFKVAHVFDVSQTEGKGCFKSR